MLEDFKKSVTEILATENVQEGFRLEQNLSRKIQEGNNDESVNECKKLLAKVKTFIIPYVSSNQFTNIIQRELIRSSMTGVDLKKRIEYKIFSYPESSQDVMRLDILKTLLRNQEIIGNRSIGEWLKEYEQSVNFKRGTSLERDNFLKKNANAQVLRKEESGILLVILDLFDFLKPGFDYREDIKSVEPINEEREEKTITPIARTLTPVSISLSQALEKYKAMGEQLVTSSPIKLKIFPSPVRPSIKNWIADYQQNLGAGRHGMMERGNFLYHSENTKRLTADERQKLAIILKSLDEEEPLDIDAERQEIVFQPTTNHVKADVTSAHVAGDQPRKETAFPRGWQITSDTQYTPHPQPLSRREKEIEERQIPQRPQPDFQERPAMDVSQKVPAMDRGDFRIGVQTQTDNQPRKEASLPRGKQPTTNDQPRKSASWRTRGEQPTTNDLQREVGSRQYEEEMPAEKEQVPTESPFPTQKKAATERRPAGPQPYRILPRKYFGSNGSNDPFKKEPKIDGNVIDLKN